MEALPRCYLELFRISVASHWGNTGRRFDFLYLFTLWRIRKTKLINGQHIQSTLLLNLFNFYDLRCRDPRDRLYALLAISDADNLDLQPDYSDLCTPAILSRRLTTALIRYSDSWQQYSNIFVPACIWRYSDHAPAKTMDDIPSWCLHLDLPIGTSLPLALPKFVWSPYPRLSGVSPLILQPGDSTLVVKGRILDHISRTTPCVF